MRPDIRTLNRTTSTIRSCQYRLWYPAGYRTGTRRRYPLMIFLHGAGERGTDINLVMRHGPPRQAAEGRKFPFFLVAPQCPVQSGWDPEVLNALLDELIEQFPLDSRRIYLTGISMGGNGTWILANTYPERFAAIVPVCGPYVWIQPERFKQIPVWCFHGAMDEAVPIEDSIRIMRMLHRAGLAARFTVYPDVGHNAWDHAYDPALYKWLLSKQRKAGPR